MAVLIISICVLLLLAYIFDITSAKTRIPSVILLLLLGWAVRQTSIFLGVIIPDLTSILPVLGTVGLILIVLEGSLELELNKSKVHYMWKSSVIALFPMLMISFGLAYALQYFDLITFKMGLANAIPFAIISSAIAIPSAKNLNQKNREFVTYESSLSDIFGVIFFNFIVLNNYIGSESFGNFLFQIFLILIVTFVATVMLSLLLSKIRHHVKFIPIVLAIILIYEIAKEFHLPALIFILLLGLFLGNLDELGRFKFMEKLHPEILDREVKKFKELTGEIAFLVRALFFLLFGYLIETADLLNSDTIFWAVLVIVGIYTLRYIFLKIFKLPIRPLVFLAPRGLITILLFLSIPSEQISIFINKSLVIQVIILTSLIMMIGLIFHSKKMETAHTEKVAPSSQGEGSQPQ